MKYFIILVSGLFANVVSAGMVEAKKDQVEVFADAKKDSAVLQKLKKGELLIAKERSGMYWSVKTKDGKTGFVSVLNVNFKSDGENMGDSLRAAVKEGRSSGPVEAHRSRSSVMGVRGLDDNDAANAGFARPNLKSVYEMEDRVTKPLEVEKIADGVEKEVIEKSN